VPSYPSGSIGFLALTNSPLGDATTVRRRDAPTLVYYSPDVHRAAFVLPAFAAAKLRRSAVDVS
jgi:spermidine synthase